MSKYRIFIGFYNIAGQIDDLQEGYRLNGHKVFSCVWKKNPHVPEGKYSVILETIFPTQLLNSKKKLHVFLRKLYSLLIFHPVFYLLMLSTIFFIDVYHLMWIKERRWKYILPVFKFFNKKIIISLVGDDVRWRPAYVEELDLLGLSHPPEDILMDSFKSQNITITTQIYTLRVCEKNADLIFSGPDLMQLALRPYHCFYIPCQFKNINFSLNQNEQITIIHATTDRNIKGTDFVISIINKILLHHPNLFRFILLENIPNNQLLKKLEDSDIVIYSPFVQGTGKFGLEAMAAGNLLMTGYDPNYLLYPIDAPVVNITPSNLEEQILFYIKNPLKRIELVNKGRKWVEDHCDILTICSRNLDLLTNNFQTPEYYPMFFRWHFQFNSKWDPPDTASVCNKWTKYVSNCRWYKNHVTVGKRNSLEF